MLPNIHYTIAVTICFLFSFLHAVAQGSCYTNYGAAALNQTFGAGNRDSLSAGKTSCLYTSDICPAQGYYTIIDSVSSCGSNNFRPMEAIPVNGNFMLVNAPAAPGVIYIDTVNNLCANTNYAFVATFMSVSLPTSCNNHPALPAFSMQVYDMSGQLISAYTGPVLVPQASTEYVDYFNTGKANNAVVIKIYDIVPGGCGNDFTMDNIVVALCGPSVQAGILNTMAPGIDICSNDSPAVVLQGVAGAGFMSPYYQWQQFTGGMWQDIPGAVTTFYQPAISDSGTYLYRFVSAEGVNIYDNNCRFVSDDVIITAHNPSPPGTASNNGPVCENGTVQLSASSAKSYQWIGPGAFSSIEYDPTFKAIPGTAGVYTVFLTDTGGCISSASTTVNILPAPTISINSTQTICIGDSAKLNASGGNTYAWAPVDNLSDPNISNPVATPQTTTNYTVTVTNSANCSDTASALVVVDTKPEISAGEDEAIIKGQSIKLDGSISNPDNVNFSWIASPTLSDITILDPVADPITNTNYILTATSTIGCGSSEDTVLIKVYPELPVPNAFTPNGDGINDVWHIPLLTNFPDAVVSIYNRYGEKIFESSKNNRDWNGRFKNALQPTGTYVYMIDLKNNFPPIKGTVILIR